MPAAPGAVVIGGARLTNEEAYAWAKLAKASSVPTRWTPSWATGSRPSWSSACPGPRSPRLRRRRVLLTLAGDLHEELPVLSSVCARPWSSGSATWSSSPRPRLTRPPSPRPLPGPAGRRPAVARALTGDRADEEAGTPRVVGPADGAAGPAAPCSPGTPTATARSWW